MSVNDPIADMLTRIRNGVLRGQTLVAMPDSKLKTEIARILKEEGFIEDYEQVSEENSIHKMLRMKLKYVGQRRDRRPVISGLLRISRPGKRVYTHKKDIPWVLSGMGIAIISTPRGVMTGQKARSQGVGGEILCKIW
jgi:small subunit ribosomal protein S8